MPQRPQSRNEVIPVNMVGFPDPHSCKSVYDHQVRANVQVGNGTDQNDGGKRGSLNADATRGQEGRGEGTAAVSAAMADINNSLVICYRLRVTYVFRSIVHCSAAGRCSIAT